MRRYPDARALLTRAFDALDDWEASFGPFEQHASLAVEEERLAEALDEYLGRLTAPPADDGGNYPFFHPRYAGQMLKPPHPVAVAAYAAAMRINPNNHALDGGPPTGQMEKEVVRDLASMFGLPDDTLGHLTGGGTTANLEALFVARELHPDQGIAFSADAHYTHGRMAAVLRMAAHPVAATPEGRIDLDALEEVLKTGRIGTVVLTATTTGLGAVDPIAEALPLLRQYGVRLHVDAAYGGFFVVLAALRANERGALGLPGFPAEHFRAIAESDSVVVDPHKHGLQPYGCGCVLFRDPSVGRFYRHDSPYTYFTSDALHLGEISLECSRPGAAAGALWLTLRALPLQPDDGLGPVLAAGLRAARRWASLIDASKALTLYTPPETDIATYFPRASSLAQVDAASQAVFEQGMADEDDPIFLSTYRMEAKRLIARHPSLTAEQPHARILHSVLMKPEHEPYVEHLHARVEALADSILLSMSS
ncbi:MAG: aspartate aminotransferase family protein [Rhodothermaceae bacterium]|nr:aspartate aminotransferase family protein [Rhodothermaceae bacterium]